MSQKQKGTGRERSGQVLRRGGRWVRATTAPHCEQPPPFTEVSRDPIHDSPHIAKLLAWHLF